MNSPELQLQAKIARQLEVMQALGKIDWFTAIVNETYTQSWNQKRKNKLAGLKKGLCDLFLIVNGKTYFIELKSPTGYLSEAQVEVLKHLNKKGEIKGFVCKSFEEFELLIDDLVNSRETKDSRYFKENMKGAKELNKKVLTT